MSLKEQRPFHAMLCKIKIVIAYIVAKIFYQKEKKPIILVGGNLGEKYEDNAAVFHRYLVDHYSAEMDIYWMYDKHFHYVEKHGIHKAVALGSFKNYLLFFRASYTVHGHSIIYDLAPYMDKFIFLNKTTTMLHISHGIECFKKILIQKEDVPLLARCDFYNCASTYEYRIKHHEWKMPAEKLVITGMARFDRLKPNNPPAKIERILFMFTWREWLFSLTEEEFIASDYFQSTVRLLQSENFRQLIEKNGIAVKVVLHPFMKKYEHYFKEARYNQYLSFYTFEEVVLMDEMQQAHMLITDYSSISWDFLYMNKPIIFYTFDQAEFLANRGSYLDLDKDLYGYKARTQQEVEEVMHHIVEGRNFENPYFDRATNYLDFFDQRNCERLAQALFTHKRT